MKYNVNKTPNLIPSNVDGLKSFPFPLNYMYLLRNNSVTGYIHLLVLEMACDPTQHADLAAVIMQEGLANVCLITSNMTIVRAKIETNIPRKRKGSCTQHDKVSETECVVSIKLNRILGFHRYLFHTDFHVYIASPFMESATVEFVGGGECLWIVNF